MVLGILEKKIYILNFLIMNEDRHSNNFGIIKIVNDLKWIDVAPIFDNDQSINIYYYDEDKLHISGESRFFYEVIPFDGIIKQIIIKPENTIIFFDEIRVSEKVITSLKYYCESEKLINLFVLVLF